MLVVIATFAIYGKQHRLLLTRTRRSTHVRGRVAAYELLAKASKVFKHSGDSD